MKLTIVAKSDREVFAGIDENGDFVVLSLDDSREIELGDVLSHGDWNTVGFETVTNLTKAGSVRICIEDWGCAKARALDLLRRLNSPTKITTLQGH